MSDRKDWLSLCNEAKAPMEEFQASWCGRCFQPECTRSLYGKTRFDERVKTWEDRLFLKVPRMDPNDPRAKEIQGKKFLDMTAATRSQSAWMDPRDLEPQKAYSIPTPPPVPAPTPVQESAPTALQVPKEPEAPVEPLPAPVQRGSQTPPALVRPSNTQVPPQQILQGTSPKQSRPVSDPWSPVQPLKPGEVLVQPGARIKLGG